MYNNTAIAFFFFFVIFIIIWIFALGGSVKEMKSLNSYEGMANYNKVDFVSQ